MIYNIYHRSLFAQLLDYIDRMLQSSTMDKAVGSCIDIIEAHSYPVKPEYENLIELMNDKEIIACYDFLGFSIDNAINSN